MPAKLTARERENAIRRYERSILAVFDGSSAADRAFGPEWYPTARASAVALAERYGFTVEQSVGVIAATSPRVDWSSNLADAETVLSWCEDSRDGSSAPWWSIRGDCSAFSANILAAIECAAADDPLTVLNGQKQRAFYRNIIGDADGVTVDVWATRAATRGRQDHPTGRAQYRLIERAYQRAAAKRSCKPRDLQAAVWLAIRDTAVRTSDRQTVVTVF